MSSSTPANVKPSVGNLVDNSRPKILLKNDEKQPAPRLGDFVGDLNPGGLGVGTNSSSGMLLGPANFPGTLPNKPSKTGPKIPGIGPRFDPPGPFAGVGGDPDNNIFLPPGGSTLFPRAP
jgi:hypothetical protein